jgi:hypothetical protein
MPMKKNSPYLYSMLCYLYSKKLPCNFVSLSFFYPDFTVGPGISPDLPFGWRALPPVWNFTKP